MRDERRGKMECPRLSELNMFFKLSKTDSKTKARLGVIHTPHGDIESPFFMPVGTRATVRTLSSEDLHTIGASIELSNAYHLYIRPGLDVIENAGGLHKFMNWNKPILTDSGGYQVFSLTKLRKITDEGVKFQSHFDGKQHLFTPEEVMHIQKVFGSDMVMPLDECAPYPCEREPAQLALERTTAWARRSKEHFYKTGMHERGQRLFGIVQGSTYQDLRERSIRELLEIGFDGYAIGGVSVGEPVKDMFETLDWVMPLMPENAPRYFMGIGMPDQIVKAVGMGIDMFDTVLPTRFGRYGTAFTSRGRVNIHNGEFIKDLSPVDDACVASLAVTIRAVISAIYLMLMRSLACACWRIITFIFILSSWGVSVRPSPGIVTKNFKKIF